MNKQQLKSHAVSSGLTENTLQKLKNKIKAEGSKEGATVDYQLQLVDELAQFDLGRFLIQNQGINGYWTHYMLTHPWYGQKPGWNNRNEPLTKLEDYLLNRAPSILATQERFEIFLQKNQRAVQDNASLACLPCGMMGELLYLNFDNIKNIKLIGIDYDPETLKDAELLALQRNLSPLVKFLERDAWQLDLHNEFDLLSSNGLNIYEPDADKVTMLYQQFYNALKPGGKLVTSFLTFPPNFTEACEWDFEEINQENLLLQKLLFVDILECKWMCFSSSEQTKLQLESVGFNEIEFIYDKARMFPTVTACK